MEFVQGYAQQYAMYPQQSLTAPWDMQATTRCSRFQDVRHAALAPTGHQEVTQPCRQMHVFSA